MFCSYCGDQMVIRRHGRVQYSNRLHGVPHYKVNLYVCTRMRWFIPWAFSRHDNKLQADTTEVYKKAKIEYDKTHAFPLPNVGNIMRKGL